MRYLLFTGLLLLTVGLFAQSTAASTWQDLAKVTYEKKYDELLGFKVDVPVFGRISGPWRAKPSRLAATSYRSRATRATMNSSSAPTPYNMCFFCGGAGPETVMEVTATEPVKYSTSRITLRGTLTLNDSNINQLMYLLSDAELVAK